MQTTSLKLTKIQNYKMNLDIVKLGFLNFICIFAILATYQYTIDKDDCSGVTQAGKKTSFENSLSSFDEAINSTTMLFVVGNPGSGTTLVKTILEVSDKIHCGRETKIIPYMLRQLSLFDAKSLGLIGEEEDSIKKAMAAFLAEIMKKNKQGWPE